MFFVKIRRFSNMDTVHGTFLASVIRLGEKYGFTSARDRCMENAKERFMTTLVDWDGLYQSDFKPEDSWSVDEKWYDAPGVFAVINLCEELGITVLLPVAYYVAIESQTLVRCRHSTL